MTPEGPDDRISRIAFVALATALSITLAVRGGASRLIGAWREAEDLRSRARRLEGEHRTLQDLHAYWDGMASRLAAGDGFLREAAVRARGFLRPGEFDVRALRRTLPGSPPGGVVESPP
ncbi:MAG: hypothetical protein HY608_00935 [Planctomycetes bacterium]|nr:hypothetical protein [Planctomycetota bacterium]